jgi:hypothetical protein
VKLPQTNRVVAQVARFAPGFHNLIHARHTMNTAAMERYNANYIGGDGHGMCGYFAAQAALKRDNPATRPHR